MAKDIILHGNTKDLRGRRFGRLAVIGLDTESSRPGKLRWSCICDCGARKSVPANKLSTGSSRSCGCLREELRTKHGHNPASGKTPEYMVWDAMIQRCENPSNKAYAIYGGRGITVCPSWREFQNFIADMGRRPTPTHCLERVNNDAGYGPHNCRWATRKEQQRNRRCNVLITYKGETMCAVDWDQRFGWAKGITSSRTKLGWSTDRIFTTPYSPRRRHL